MYGSYLQKAAETYRLLADDPVYPALFEQIADALRETLENGGKILLAGNGGSAADSQHLAGELVVRFRKTRRALPAIALTVDTSVLTAALNDCGVEVVFSRQVEALGRRGDLLWAFSTSGNSRNIVVACETARNIGMRVVCFTGSEGGALAELADFCFRAPSRVTSHVQECHIAAGHMLCGVTEDYFSDKPEA